MLEPRCAECWDDDAEMYVEYEEQTFIGGRHSETLCLSCAVDVAMDEYGFEDREEARHSILAAVSG